jgi:hypothetical protein
MTKCYGNGIGGICVSRQGKVLSKRDLLEENFHCLPDKDVCRHKQGKICGFSGVHYTQANAYSPGETPEDRELYVFDKTTKEVDKELDKVLNGEIPDPKLSYEQMKKDVKKIKIKVKNKNMPLDEKDIFDVFFKNN